MLVVCKLGGCERGRVFDSIRVFSVFTAFLVAECLLFNQESERCWSYRVSVYPVVRSDGWRIHV